jgi:hypothetical protein
MHLAHLAPLHPVCKIPSGPELVTPMRFMRTRSVYLLNVSYAEVILHVRVAQPNHLPRSLPQTASNSTEMPDSVMHILP